jgi:hypothetical protein
LEKPFAHTHDAGEAELRRRSIMSMSRFEKAWKGGLERVGIAVDAFGEREEGDVRLRGQEE